MAFIEWNEKMDVGDEKCNTQHQHLVEQINKLHDAMKKGSGREVVKEILLEVLDYTQYHFEYEEKRLEEIGFPGLEKHKKKHAQLLEEVERLKAEAKEKTFTLSLEVMDFLNNWISNHIKIDDMEYKKYI